MSGPTRRRMLGILVGGAGVAGAEKVGSASTPVTKACYGMVVDLEKCIRCGACVVACASENNIPPLGELREARSRPIHWMDLLSIGDSNFSLGKGPIPTPCMHCEDSPCTKVCPVGATHKTDEGIVAQIWERCIGCRACMVACPYSRRYYTFSPPDWSGSYAPGVNPDVAVRPLGVVEKCTFCHHRLRAAKEKAALDEVALTDAALAKLPACAAACPTEAIVFGDLNTWDSMVAQLARSPRSVRLLDHLGTGPKVIYLRRKS